MNFALAIHTVSSAKLQIFTVENINIQLEEGMITYLEDTVEVKSGYRKQVVDKWSYLQPDL